MDFSRMNWSGDFMFSEVYDPDIPEDEDRVVGYYTVKDFPEINMYIDVENGKILEVWLDE